jgi:DnaK suppressor protein
MNNQTFTFEDIEMKKTFIKKITTSLKNEYAELAAKFERAKATEIDVDGDETDLIQARVLALATAQLAVRDKQRMVLIEKTLKNIALGTFGDCQECGEPIGEKRLSINPAFITCIDCAELLEKMKKKFRSA